MADFSGYIADKVDWYGYSVHAQATVGHYTSALLQYQPRHLLVCSETHSSSNTWHQTDRKISALSAMQPKQPFSLYIMFLSIMLLYWFEISFWKYNNERMSGALFICDQADIYLGLSVRPSGRPSVCPGFLTTFPLSEFHETCRVYWPWIHEYPGIGLKVTRSRSRSQRGKNLSFLVVFSYFRELVQQFSLDCADIT